MPYLRGQNQRCATTFATDDRRLAETAKSYTTFCTVCKTKLCGLLDEAVRLVRRSLTKA